MKLGFERVENTSTTLSYAPLIHSLAVALELDYGIAGRISSVGCVLGSLSCMMQRQGFYPALVEGIFPRS